MEEVTAEVKLKTGLQARPAALFVQEANKFHADVHIEKDGSRANAKSIMGIMSLAIRTGTSVKILTEGSDETEAAQALKNFVETED
ncbi:catabolite repression HPr-like protein [Salsuginibacillus halophilus]|uniref:Catabolite repression HPr-like protein n=1 Tax=Salsuginibacillus halophilus TaxID=517424 RepID=A0A2P8HL84_9BACI|nr:HPr family phosphocarrier protein [Salsuginibacillus halophilus]PSL46979.1 catabolite repression HPr-like protein [Salsuginibacillus halophilus]